MFNILRRKILSGIGSSTLLCWLPGHVSVPTANADMRRTAFTEGAYSHGCLFARKAAVPDESSSVASIDFWTLWVSDFQLDASMPVSRVVVWDDLFSRSNLKKQLETIFNGLSQYFDIEPSLASAFEFHLEGFSEIGPTISNLFEGVYSHSTAPRIALIDINSCGLWRVDWSIIIPQLRKHYDLIVGFAKFAGRGPGDLLAAFDVEFDNTGGQNDWDGWTVAAQCDVTF